MRKPDKRCVKTGASLWAANLPMSRIQRDARDRIPRHDTSVVLFDQFWLL
ncbi:hypothetical protein GN316_21100 [Xylophilus sp. Kf1]|nr:hypothetical protein [Xylophilus sp. Kf1]